MPRILGYFAMEWGEAEAVKWARALLDDQKLLVTNSPAINFLRSGERDMIIADGAHAYIGYRQQGMDAASQLLDYVPATQFIVSQVKSSPHPYAPSCCWHGSVRRRPDDVQQATGFRHPPIKIAAAQADQCAGRKPL